MVSFFCHRFGKHKGCLTKRPKKQQPHAPPEPVIGLADPCGFTPIVKRDAKIQAFRFAWLRVFFCSTTLHFGKRTSLVSLLRSLVVTLRQAIRVLCPCGVLREELGGLSCYKLYLTPNCKNSPVASSHSTRASSTLEARGPC